MPTDGREEARTRSWASQGNPIVLASACRNAAVRLNAGKIDIHVESPVEEVREEVQGHRGDDLRDLRVGEAGSANRLQVTFDAPSPSGSKRHSLTMLVQKVLWRRFIFAMS